MQMKYEKVQQCEKENINAFFVLEICSSYFLRFKCVGLVKVL